MLAGLVAACTRPPALGGPAATGDAALRALHDRYVVGFLRRNPVVSTYLGGAGLHPSLAAADERLRDHSAAALAAEDRWLTEMQAAFERIEPATLSENARIDRDVALAQIRFLLHQHRDRRYPERALDTYTDEPFRAIDWLLQGMTASGTPDEWRNLVRRVRAIPRFFEAATAQIAAGVKSGNTPDARMLLHNGVETSEANAKYFEKGLLEAAAKQLASGPARDEILAELRGGGPTAARAFRDFRDFIAATFFADARAPSVKNVKREFQGDRFVLGEAEYDWALRNNFRVDKRARALYEESWSVVEKTRADLVALARRVAATHR